LLTISIFFYVQVPASCRARRLLVVGLCMSARHASCLWPSTIVMGKLLLWIEIFELVFKFVMKFDLALICWKWCDVQFSWIQTKISQGQCTIIGVYVINLYLLMAYGWSQNAFSSYLKLTFKLLSNEFIILLFLMNFNWFFWSLEASFILRGFNPLVSQTARGMG